MDGRPCESNRRTFLKLASSASIGLLCAEGASAAPQVATPLELSDEHRRAADRRRRVVVHYDAYNALGVDFEEWIKFRFAYADEPGSQIDAIWWDIGPLGPAVYPGPKDNPKLEPWRKLGIDWVGRLVQEHEARAV